MKAPERIYIADNWEEQPYLYSTKVTGLAENEYLRSDLANKEREVACGFTNWLNHGFLPEIAFVDMKPVIKGYYRKTDLFNHVSLKKVFTTDELFTEYIKSKQHG